MKVADFLLGINAGGGAFTDSSGHLYGADPLTGGKTFSTQNSIADTIDDTLYQSERWTGANSFKYDISVPSGSYYVELKFAEIFAGVGQRSFDVSIEGVQVLDELDIVASSGGLFTAFDSGHFVDVDDGTLTVTVSKGAAENPKINAIGVFNAVEDGVPTPNPKPTVKPTPKPTPQPVVSGDDDDPTTVLTEVNSLADLTVLTLKGIGNLNNPTSIDVGADGKLYVSQQDGEILQLTLLKEISTDSQGIVTATWSVTETKRIDAIKKIPNFDDDGCYNPSVTSRQVTGLFTDVDENGLVVLYVTSSDSRIGGQQSQTFTELDTNSGIISRLTQVPDGNGGLKWDRVDLVRGLPRSEENHSINGIRKYTTASGRKFLIVCVGGNTNTGAPGPLFLYLPEYYYSGSIIAVDLDMLESMEANNGVKTYTTPPQNNGGNPVVNKYLFDLPTLDDPTRANVPGTNLDQPASTCNSDIVVDVMGGNEGLNMAIRDDSGVVRIIASGFRNQFDLAIGQDGSLYTVDNGSNGGWGGNPTDANGNLLVDNNNDGIPDIPGVNLASEQGQANNADSLHRIGFDIDAILESDPLVHEDYYGGHPNLMQAYGEAAGIYLYERDKSSSIPFGNPLKVVNGNIVETSEPEDSMPEISNAGDILGDKGPDPRKALYKSVGQRKGGIKNAPNGALFTWVSSTNGVDEYTSGPGQLQGQLIQVSFNGDISGVSFFKEGENGVVGNVKTNHKRSLTSKPLDLVCQGPNDPYPGVIFVASYGADQIIVMSPEETLGQDPNPNDRDQDGVDDTIDPFAADPNNGLADFIEPGQTLVWTFTNGGSFPNDNPDLFDGGDGLYNGGDIGFTGIMTNRAGIPETLYDNDNIIFGGAPGFVQIKATEFGNAYFGNNQRNGFQFGINPQTPGLEVFKVRTKIDNYFDALDGIPSTEKLEQGLTIGSGEQNNFVSISLVQRPHGAYGFEVYKQFSIEFTNILDKAVILNSINDPSFLNPGGLDTVELGFDVDVAAGEATPVWSYTINDGTSTVSGSFDPIALGGEALQALQGTLTLPGDQGDPVDMGFAVGVVASRGCNCGGEIVVAINAGSPDETLKKNFLRGKQLRAVFLPDDGAPIPGVTLFGNSRTYVWPQDPFAIKGTALDILHDSDRRGRGPWGYVIDTEANGEFEVILYFSEPFATNSAKSRSFDITINGVAVVTDYSIFDEVGKKNQATISHILTVTDQTITITFQAEAGIAKVSGLLVKSATTVPFPTNFDLISIEGVGNVPDDLSPPTVTLTVQDGVVADDPLYVEVDYAHSTELDESTLSLDDLDVNFNGGNLPVLSSQLVVSADKKTATATYELIPSSGWGPADVVTVSIAAGSVASSFGVTNTQSPSYTFQFAQDNQDTLIAAINGGLPNSFTASDGITYSDSPDSMTGTVNEFNTKNNNLNIQGTQDDELYRGEYWCDGPCSFSLSVPNGNYQVEIGFAEVFHDQSGDRIFDVTLEGLPWLTNYDIYATVGANTADVYQHVVAVTDGTLTLALVPGVENPKISYFSVSSTTGQPTLT